MQFSKLLFLRVAALPGGLPYLKKTPITSLAIGGYENLFKRRPNNFHFYLKKPLLDSRFQIIARDTVKCFGCKFNSNVAIGLSAAAGFLTVSSCKTALADNDLSQETQNRHSNSSGWWEGQSKILSWIRKFWIPIVVFTTVFMGWQYPMTLGVNILCILFSTKPTPNSIYLWIEEWREKNRYDKFDWLKGAAVLHVEVLDCKLLCLAKVSSINQQMTMVGALGNWWILSSKSHSLKYFPSISHSLGELVHSII